MTQLLPGSQIKCEIISKESVSNMLSNIFYGGGLVLSQVSRLSGVEPYTIQNWIKRGFCSPPISKQYSKRQFCRLITINMLKDSLSIPQIVSMLSFINGHLDDESDDMIDDTDLYLYFISVIISLGENNLSDELADSCIDKALTDYHEPFEGGKARLKKVLMIMTVAYFAAELKRKADILTEEIY